MGHAYFTWAVVSYWLAQRDILRTAVLAKVESGPCSQTYISLVAYTG